METTNPLRDDRGPIISAINCFQHITNRKLAQGRRIVLINKLNHRIKHTLTMVQAIAAHTSREGVGKDAPKWF